MTKVYRVEHKQGRNGPYIEADRYGSAEGYALSEFYMEKHDRCECHPSPYKDGLFNRYRERDLMKNYIYGFETVEALKKWFGGSGLALENSGFIITVYEVDDKCIRRGDYDRYLEDIYDPYEQDVDKYNYSGQIAFRKSFQARSYRVTEYRPTKILGRVVVKTPRHKYPDYEEALRWAREEV